MITMCEMASQYGHGNLSGTAAKGLTSYITTVQPPVFPGRSVDGGYNAVIGHQWTVDPVGTDRCTQWPVYREYQRSRLERPITPVITALPHFSAHGNFPSRASH